MFERWARGASVKRKLLQLLQVTSSSFTLLSLFFLQLEPIEWSQLVLLSVFPHDSARLPSMFCCPAHPRLARCAAHTWNWCIIFWQLQLLCFINPDIFGLVAEKVRRKPFRVTDLIDLCFVKFWLGTAHLSGWWMVTVWHLELTPLTLKKKTNKSWIRVQNRAWKLIREGESKWGGIIDWGEEGGKEERARPRTCHHYRKMRNHGEPWCFFLGQRVQHNLTDF